MKRLLLPKIIMIIIGMMIGIIMVKEQNKVNATTLCGAGYYYTGCDNECAECPPGYFCDGQNVKEPCPIGTTSVKGSTDGANCTSCETGTYSLEAGAASCKACPAGFECTAVGTRPTACSAGEYSLEGNETCIACPEGSYCPSKAESPIECPRGYYTSATTQTSCTVCPDGEYTEATGATGCTPCPSGSYCPNTKDNAPQNCTAGSYIAAGTTHCQLCPAGSYCNSITANPAANLCPAGTYTEIGLNTECKQCPAGYYAVGTGNSACTPCERGKSCVDPTLAPQDCPAGTYSPNLESGCEACPEGTYQTGTNAVQCNTCPLGQRCSDPTSAPVDCGAGNINHPRNRTQCLSCGEGYKTTGAQNAVCTPCPPGEACPGDGTFSTCAAGTYSTGMAVSCTTCPAGHVCPSTSAPPVMCTSGYAGTGESGSCTACPAGQECVNPAKTPTNCPANYYSPLGVDKCSPCPPGKSCTSTASSDCASGEYSPLGNSTCYTCPGGYSCPKGSLMPILCPMGYYSLGNAEACTICPAGSYCDKADEAPKTCASGFVSSVGSVECKACDQGFYCPTNQARDARPCPQGTYSNSSQSSCTPCPAGFFCKTSAGYSLIGCQPGTYSLGSAIRCKTCPAGFQCSNTAANPVACPAGTYSRAGAFSCTSCPAGHQCSDPSALPQLCVAGTYSEDGASSCSTCSGGYVCPVGTPADNSTNNLCTRGTFCPEGSVAPSNCPAGTYGTKNGAVSQADGCTTCPEGYFCAAGTLHITDTLQCRRGHFCPPGTKHATEFACPAGTYNSLKGSINSHACLDCPEGYFCAAGSITYITQPCPAGRYCPVNTTSAYDHLCPQGTFNALSRQTSIDACLPCPPGFGCSANNVPNPGLPAPNPCNRGSYQPNPSTGGCIGCPAGFPCPLTMTTNPYIFRCHQGHYCPGSSGAEEQTACRAGTYTYRNDITNLNDCEICPGGYACPTGSGGRSTPVACARGHYCPGAPHKSIADIIYTLGAYGGTYRGTVVANEFPCPAGTYSPHNSLKAASECTPCPPGMWCTGGLHRISGACEKGHYCPIRSYSPTQKECPAGTFSSATNISSIYDCKPCYKGHYCGPAEIEPQPCPPGTYTRVNRTEHIGPTYFAEDKACMVCPEGYYCPGATVDPIICSNSYYSPNGSSTCTICPAGHYCPTNTTAEIQLNTTYRCPAGHYCPEGTGEYPELTNHTCPKGHFCVEATPLPEDCPPGTYGPNTGRKSAAECTICPAGSFCVGGQAEISGKCREGHYCPQGSSNDTAIGCPPRTYRRYKGARNHHDCNICPNGYYCPGSTDDPLDCPAGYYCIVGTAEPESCPIGTFSNTTNLKDYIYCTACPAGKYCEGFGNIKPSGLCDPGFYCSGSSFTSSPPDTTGGECPKGGYCNYGSSYPSTCDKGTFNNYIGGRTQEDCYSCPEGQYCAGSNRPVPSGPCAAGWYCTGGAFLPTQHEVGPGHFSLSGASAPSPCQPGTYQIAPKQASCAPCPEGNYCPNTAMQSYIPCTAGHYCPEGTDQPIDCAAGTYGILTGLKNQSECLDCDPGSFCVTPGRTSPDGDCQAGHYCRSGAAVAAPTDGVTGDVCPPGHYCPTKTADPFPCPVGKFLATTGADDILDCTDCTAGSYCESHGLGAPTGPCKAGFYCNASSSTNMPTDGVMGNVCPEGFQCPEGTHTPEHCPKGTFADVTSYAECLTCPKGYYCGTTRTVEPTLCPAGRYCPAGTTDVIPQCPPGSYNPHSGVTNMTGCTLCDGGTYCPTAGMTSTGPACDASYFCLSGAINAQGGLGVLGGASGDCPSGHYCPSGVVKPKKCPIGTYFSGTSATAVTDCVNCDGGKYCPEAGQTESSLNCSAGHYCTSKATISGPIDGVTGNVCTKGHYCPEGTTVPINCPEGTYSNVLGLSDCTSCPEGYYCPEGAIDPINCPRGHYCPEGTNSTGLSNFRCPPGSFSNVTNLKNMSECSPCTGGKYCADYGLYEPTGPCIAGVFCYSGASESNGTIGILGGESGECPKGHYCTEGTVFALSCPIGSFSNESGNTSPDNCQGCSGGHYCNEPGLILPKLDCAEGFYCTQNSTVEAPKDGVKGNICPKGFYCPRGSTSPIGCANGTYSSELGRSACLTCPAGFYCINNAQTPTDCPQGHFCPSGTGTTIPSCPPGTFTDQFGLDKLSECALCPGGKYCLGGGASPDGNCIAGIYCKSGAKLPNGTVYTGGEFGACPTGKYCPEGSTVPKSCPRGTFNSVSGSGNLDNCTQCTGGKYCEQSGLSAVTGDCDEGFFCPTGSSSAHLPKNVCPAGYRCPAGTEDPISCVNGTYQTQPGQSTCLSCPQGHYCPPGTVEPIACPNTSYCLVGVTQPSYCPNGTYGTKKFLTHPTECSECPSGKHCSFGVIAGDCEAGYYCAAAASTATPNTEAASSVCKPGCQCPPGYYCPAGTKAPIPCPAGNVSSVIGATNISSCGVCDPGYWCLGSFSQPLECPVGKYCPNDVTNNPIDCPKGTFNPVAFGSSIASCRNCTPSFYCPKEGLTNPEQYPCPVGQYCPEKSILPIDCPQGTYNPHQNKSSLSDCLSCPRGFYCGAKTSFPLECPVGKWCPGGNSLPGPCPSTHFCGAQEQSPSPCPSGFYCPDGTASPIHCKIGYYCPANSSAPTPCPYGYQALNFTRHREELHKSCVICPAGTYGNDTDHLHCRPCAAGYVCKRGARRARPTREFIDNGYICPAGYACPLGSSIEIPCEPGTFSGTEGNANLACTKCAASTFINTFGSEACLPCGTSSVSTEDRKTCQCKGENRVYQPLSGFCVCKTGYVVYENNEDLSQEDGVRNCMELVRERCQTGFVRDVSGKCIEVGDESCFKDCGEAGGEISEATNGLCECNQISVVADICDATCRDNRLRLVYNTRSKKLEVYDPVGDQVLKEYDPSVITSGVVSCAQERCELELTKMTTTGFLGVYKTNVEYWDSLFESQGTTKKRRSLLHVARNFPSIGTVSNSTQSHLEPLRVSAVAPTIVVPSDGIARPVACLELFEGMIWDVTEPGHYPEYVRDSPFNTNDNFDASPFTELKTRLNSNESISAFVYFFQENGTYVFRDASEDSDQISIIRVLGDGLTCSSETFVPLTSDSLTNLNVDSSEPDSLQPDYILIAVIGSVVLLFVILLLVGVHFYRTRSFHNLSGSRPKFKKQVTALDHMDSKLNNSFLTSFEVDDDDETTKVDLEAFDVKLFYDRLAENQLAANSAMKRQRDDLQAEYDHIFKETKIIRELLGQRQDELYAKINIDDRLDVLEPIKTKEQGVALVKKLQQQLHEVRDEKKKAGKLNEIQELDDMQKEDAKVLDSEDVLHRNNLIKTYNLYINKLSDLNKKMDDEDVTEQALKRNMNTYNMTLNQSIKKLRKNMQEVNAVADRRKGFVQRRESKWSFTLDNESGMQLKSFITKTLQDMFVQYAEEENKEDEEKRNELIGNKDAGADFSDSDDESEELLSKSEDELTEMDRLELSIRDRRHKLKRVQLNDIQDLNESIDQEYLKEKENLEKQFKAKQEINERFIKKQLRRKLAGVNNKAEQTAIVKESRNLLDQYAESMAEEEQNQLNSLRRRLEKKKSRQNEYLKEKQKKERELHRIQAKAERSDLENLLKKLDEERADAADAKQAELNYQRQLLEWKLKMRANRRMKNNVQEKVTLKNMMDNFNEIDRETMAEYLDERDESNKRVLKLGHDVTQSSVSDDKEAQQKLIKTHEEESQKYIDKIKVLRARQEADLEKLIRENTDMKQQQLENRQSINEQRSIKQEEKMLEKITEMMSGSSSTAAETLSKRKDVLETKSKLDEIASRRADMKRKIENELETRQKELDDSHKRHVEEYEKEWKDEVEKTIKAKKDAIDQTLDQGNFDENQRKQILDAHARDIEDYENEMKREREEQLEALHEKLEERRRRLNRDMKKKLDSKMQHDLSIEEKLLTKGRTIESGPPIMVELSRKSKNEIEEFKKNNQDRLKNLEDKYLEEDQELVQNIATEERFDDKRRQLAANQEKSRQLLKSKMDGELAAVKERDKARILSQYDHEMNMLEKTQKQEAEKQEAAFKERLAQRRARLKKKHESVVAQTQKEIEEEEEELTNKKYIEAEKKQILDLLMDQSSGINSVDEAVARVLSYRQDREVVAFDTRYKLKLDKMQEEGASKDQLNDIRIEIRSRRVKLLKKHMKERDILNLEFKKYSKLLRKGNEEERKLQEDLEKFQEMIQKQKDSNMKKIERQKSMLKKQMEEELESERAKIRAEQERLRTRLESQKNSLAVEQLMKEQENEQEKLIQEQKNLEKDQREQLLADHRQSMAKFQDALEKEHARQNKILEHRIEKHLRRIEHEASEGKFKKLNESFTGIKKQTDGEGVADSESEASSTVSRQEKTNSIIKLIEGDAKAVKLEQHTIKTAISLFPQEHRWVVPIYKRIKNIESRVLSEKRTYYDPKDPSENEGELLLVEEGNLTIPQLLVYRFGQFTINLFREKFRFVPDIKLLIASKLPTTDYKYNSFRHSFFYDKRQRILHIRNRRLDTVGNLLLMLCHCLGHICANDGFVNDNNPEFLKFFYLFLSTMNEDLFTSRQNGKYVPNAELDKAPERRKKLIESLIVITVSNKSADSFLTRLRERTGISKQYVASATVNAPRATAGSAVGVTVKNRSRATNRRVATIRTADDARAERERLTKDKEIHEKLIRDSRGKIMKFKKVRDDQQEKANIATSDDIKNVHLKAVNDINTQIASAEKDLKKYSLIYKQISNNITKLSAFIAKKEKKAAAKAAAKAKK